MYVHLCNRGFPACKRKVIHGTVDLVKLNPSSPYLHKQIIIKDSNKPLKYIRMSHMQLLCMCVHCVLMKVALHCLRKRNFCGKNKRQHLYICIIYSKSVCPIVPT